MIDKIISYLYNKKMKKYKIKEINSLPLEISIIMNFECNYNCVYCCAYKPKDKSEYRKYNGGDWNKIFTDFYKKYGRCDIVLTGGEPLLYKDSIDFFIDISRYHYIHLSTNLSIEKEIVEKIIMEGNLKNIYASASYHPDKANLDQFIEKIQMLKDHGADMHVVMVLYPELLDSINYYDKMFRSVSLPISYFPFIGQYKGRTFPTEYSEKELEIVRKFAKGYSIGAKVDKVAQLNTRGMLCFAGIKSISINPFGDVRRCITYGKTMGNIFDKSFKLYDEPMPCEENVCGCISYWKYHLRVDAIRYIIDKAVLLKPDPFETNVVWKVVELYKKIIGLKNLTVPEIISPLENEYIESNKINISWKLKNDLDLIEDIELRIRDITIGEGKLYIFRLPKHRTNIKIPKKIIMNCDNKSNSQMKYTCTIKVRSSDPSKYLDSEFNVPRIFSLHS